MTRPTTAARRYAEAAFEMAERDDAFEAWTSGLQLVAGVAADEAVARNVDNPAIFHGEREGSVVTLFEGRVSAGVLNLTRLLARRGRFEMLPAVLNEFTRLVNHRNGVLEATVTSALPLAAGQSDALSARIATMTGSAVSLITEVDERLIGGLTLRIGDQLLDASVRGRLERLRDRLVASSR